VRISGGGNMLRQEHRDFRWRGLILEASSILLCLFMVSPPGHSASWRVERDGSGDYSTIQPAVDNAAPGDTILIGPGRYIEYQPFSPTKDWPIDTYIGVTVDSLTIMGVDRDLTIIGPDTPNISGYGPKGLVTKIFLSDVTISNLTFSNLYGGVYLNIHGTVDNCVLDHCHIGISCFSEDGALIENSYFNDLHLGGVATWAPCANITIEECEFVDVTIAASFGGTGGVVVMRSNFIGGAVGVQIDEGSNGTVSDCDFRDVANVAIVIGVVSSAGIFDNYIEGGCEQVQVTTNSHLEGSGNRLLGGSCETILFAHSTASFNNNHIFRNGGRLIYLDVYYQPPDVYLDLSDNYWGMTEADSIAQYILDGNDDPSIHAFVNFEPFSAVPIGTEQKSWGGVKELYRSQGPNR
jgi:hypothetical protein